MRYLCCIGDLDAGLPFYNGCSLLSLSCGLQHNIWIRVSIWCNQSTISMLSCGAVLDCWSLSNILLVVAQVWPFHSAIVCSHTCISMSWTVVSIVPSTGWAVPLESTSTFIWAVVPLAQSSKYCWLEFVHAVVPLAQSSEFFWVRVYSCFVYWQWLRNNEMIIIFSNF